MKFVYYIDDQKFELKEGYIDTDYVDDYYDDCKYNTVIYSKESHAIDVINNSNIFDNIETAKYILKGMIQIKRDRNSKEIEILQKENEILFEKLLNM